MKQLGAVAILAAAPPAVSDEPNQDPAARALRDRIAKRVGLAPKGTVKIGRFVITGRLGVGGMGVVHRAFDPDLDRAVAIKVLDDRRDSAQERLIREAQAMARLGHPNVVAIHEVGRHENAVYIAMEIVEGGTLTKWLRDEGRTPTQILEVFAMAGRGLQAAHEAGLVHRDFKPDNVLVGTDGRARVADFGLARASEDIFESVEGVDDELRDTKLVRTLSRTGAISGTPRYMAPEQFEGRKTDARTDQFSFCVALWEALCGEAPFPGDSVPKLAEAVTRGRRREPPAGARLGTAIRRTLERGLATRPDDRFESMVPLLDALRPKSNRLVQVAGFGTLVALAGVALVLARDEAPVPTRADPCEATDEGLDAVWGEERSSKVTALLRDVDVPEAAVAATRITDRVDAYAERWRRLRRDACRATRVEGSMSDEGFDLTVRCLDLTLTQVGVFVDALGEPDQRTLDIALGAPLPSLARCEDLDGLRRGFRSAPEGHEAEVAQGEAALARSNGYGSLGDYEQALGQADTALEIAERIDFAPLRVKAQHARGSALQPMARSKQAVEALSAAGLEGLEIGDDVTAANAEAYRMFVEATSLSQPAQAFRDLERVQALIVRARLDPWNHGLAARYIGAALATHGRFEEARRSFATAKRLYDEMGWPLYAADIDCDAGLTYAEVGDFETARPKVQGCYEARLERFGSTHPGTNQARLNLGMLTADSGHPAEARPLLHETIEAYAARGITEDPRIAIAYEAIGNTYDDEDEPQLAVEPLRRGLAMREATLGPDNPRVGMSCTNLANVLRKTGALDEAVALHERALKLLHDDGPPPLRASAHYGVAQTLRALGREEEGCEHARAALEIAESLEDPKQTAATRALVEDCER